MLRLILADLPYLVSLYIIQLPLLYFKYSSHMILLLPIFSTKDCFKANAFLHLVQRENMNE